MAEKNFYIVTPENLESLDESFNEEVMIAKTLKSAKKLQKQLIHDDGEEQCDDCPPSDYRVYKLVLVS